ncbi:T9SS type A sorting domain-containing protein [Flavobacterium pectinovorum]|uniref:T9SS C-terminal target domain-containing protein n=1 Tax=Flavobacterium pectinovorum TaxID=29533 RepID=A0A502EEJ3_9FLAO|nr:T9SS type A sorting domain-containing protein [Flavobacterium pectinovorum]TPG35402.1 T9SS C-terminal target domain-containing protein [Flavobacterium pectinovorum]
MKHILTLLLFGTFTLSFAQQKILFGYDTAGNQISRTLCLSGCPTFKKVKEIKEIEAVVDEDLQKFFPEDQISYYPNPVKEELYLKWELLDDNKVSSILVYGVSGQLLNSYSNTERSNTQNISFQSYSTGVYLVVLNYSNGDQKTIKIIKQ